ncbi:hypothetical protein [Clostridium ganghwense]|uniref:Uncharacterized protein n=1 Tax=Clostridium ganghwense TaxID=312089 RepID=A0ABT4CLW6_9CLOT|nr:hypothetical protein [Clostridium ganghwense]MCY6370045.1 hypothetical protein [Clostridium ganghwense]
MKVTKIIDGPGPLPLCEPFNVSSCKQLFFVSGSAWRTDSPKLLEIQVIIDSTIEATLRVWTNESNSHKTLIPVLFETELAVGEHTVQLIEHSDAIGDQNDYYQVTMIEYC